MDNNFRREVQVNGGSARIYFTFYLRCPKATMQFVVRIYSTPNIGPTEAVAEFSDLGYHADAPTYEGDQSRECKVRGGKDCYYHGTSLGAEELGHKLFNGGDIETIWEELRRFYVNKCESDQG